ncbi:hypothetical protein ABR763_26465 [Bacillus cereus]
MNIERKYIAETISSMTERIEHTKTVIRNFENEINNLDEHDHFGIGIRRGYIGGHELEVEFLERQIAFLKGALEN